MELDELKAVWKRIDRSLELQNDLELRRYREGRLDKARARLRPLYGGQTVQIVAGGLLVVMSAAFWATHRDTAHLMLSGMIMHAYGLLLIVVGARTIHLMNRIDYSAPIVTIQKQLARLRGFYIRCGMTIGLAWWLLWIPFMTMVLGFAGVDVIRSAPAVVVAGTLGGIAGLLLTLWFHHWSRRPGRPRLARFMKESVTGTSLLSAQAFIDELAEFEKES